MAGRCGLPQNLGSMDHSRHGNQDRRQVRANSPNCLSATLPNVTVATSAPRVPALLLHALCWTWSHLCCVPEPSPQHEMGWWQQLWLRHGAYITWWELEPLPPSLPKPPIPCSRSSPQGALWSGSGPVVRHV